MNLIEQEKQWQLENPNEEPLEFWKQKGLIEIEAITFIREFGRENKPIAAICHGPWTLIDADLVTGKRMTSWPTLQLDLQNAGARWTDEQVVVDGKLVTSRKPDDIPAFNQAILSELAAVQPGQTGAH